MRNITGAITKFLEALNCNETDTRVQSVITALGGAYDTQTYNDTEIEEKYLSMPNQGVEFLLQDGILGTIFIYATQSDEHNAYDDWGTLIEGLDAGSSREEIRAMLGEPIKSGSLHDVYKINPNNRFIHFEFDASNQQLTKITLMAEDPFANPLADAAEQSTNTLVNGTISVLAAAIGHIESDPEVKVVISLFDSHYTTGAPSGGPDVITRYLHFGEGTPLGHIQFKNDKVASIYASTGMPFDDPVPEGLRLHNLIDGLAQKATRENIQAVLPEPYLKEKNLELYALNGVSVHFTYMDNVPVDFAVSALPTKSS